MSLSLSLRFSLLSIVMICVVACQARQSGGDVVQAQDTDFASLTAEDRTKLIAKLAPALGVDLPAEGDQRSGPQFIQAEGDALYAAWLQAGSSDQLLFIKLNAAGELQWTAELPLGLPFGKSHFGPDGPVGAPVLRIDCSGGKAGAATVLLFAVRDDGLACIRAMAGNGSLANIRLDQDHPALPLSPGEIGSESRVDRLAATVWLAAGEQAMERGKAATRSHLEQFAVGTDTWLAQAAAELLTLPTK